MGVGSIVSKPETKALVQETPDAQTVTELQETIRDGELLTQLMQHKGYAVFQRAVFRRFQEASDDLRKAKTIEEMRSCQAVLDALESVGGIVPSGAEAGIVAAEQLKGLIARAKGEESDES